MSAVCVLLPFTRTLSIHMYTHLLICDAHVHSKCFKAMLMSHGDSQQYNKKKRKESSRLRSHIPHRLLVFTHKHRTVWLSGVCYNSFHTLLCLRENRGGSSTDHCITLILIPGHTPLYHYSVGQWKKRIKIPRFITSGVRGNRETHVPLYHHQYWVSWCFNGRKV